MVRYEGHRPYHIGLNKGKEAYRDMQLHGTLQVSSLQTLSFHAGRMAGRRR